MSRRVRERQIGGLTVDGLTVMVFKVIDNKCRVRAKAVVELPELTHRGSVVVYVAPRTLALTAALELEPTEVMRRGATRRVSSYEPTVLSDLLTAGASPYTDVIQSTIADHRVLVHRAAVAAYLGLAKVLGIDTSTL